MTSATRTLSGSSPFATTRPMMSRSDTIPASRFPESTATAPTRRSVM